MDLEARLRLQRGRLDFNIDLSVDASGLVGVYGESGAGKTTLLRCIAGLERPRGRLQLGDDVWLDTERRINVPTFQRATRVVFQDGRLFPHLSVLDNLRFGLKRSRSLLPVMGEEQVVDMLGIERLLKQRPQTLSGGEQQRVAIGRALLAAPKLILMDEPLASLDHERKLEIIPFLQAIRRTAPVPIIYVSHNVDELAALADTVVRLQAGAVRAVGPASELVDTLLISEKLTRGEWTAWSGSVLRHDLQYGIVEVDTPQGVISAISRPLEKGSAVEILFSVREVALSVRRPIASSALNVVPATVLAPICTHGPWVRVTLRTGALHWCASIPRRRFTELGIAEGQAVFVQLGTVHLRT